MQIIVIDRVKIAVLTSDLIMIARVDARNQRQSTNR